MARSVRPARYNYRVTSPVERCTCCGRPWRLLRPEEGGRDLCRACQPHAGNPLQEVREHRTMWWELLARVEAAHGSEVQDLTERIHGLRVQLDERPERQIEVVINQDEFSAVRQDMERAFRQRDHAYLAILELLLVHRLDETETKCICGRPAKDCAAAEVLEDARDMIRGWERKQIELFREGRQGWQLPASHPAVLDRRISNDGGIA